MRWFCASFMTLVVVSTALSRAGDAPSADAPLSAVAVDAAQANLAFDMAEISTPRRPNPGIAWGAALLLGVPFLARRRRERLS